MNSAAHRLEELKTLQKLLEQGEEQKFFELLFPEPEEHGSSIYRTAMEEIVLSSKKRELIRQFARLANDNLAGKARAIIYRYMHVLGDEAVSEDTRFQTTTKRAVSAAKALQILHRLRDDMQDARQIRTSTPPPSEDLEIKAA
jgi:hypothetical protein